MTPVTVLPSLRFFLSGLDAVLDCIEKKEVCWYIEQLGSAQGKVFAHRVMPSILDSEFCILKHLKLCGGDGDPKGIDDGFKPREMSRQGVFTKENEAKAALLAIMQSSELMRRELGFSSNISHVHGDSRSDRGRLVPSE